MNVNLDWHWDGLTMISYASDAKKPVDAKKLQEDITYLKGRLEQAKPEDCPVRRLDSMEITDKTFMYYGMSREELAEKGISLAIKPEKPVHVRPDRYLGILPDNVVDNTKEFREFRDAHYLKNGYQYDENGELSYYGNTPRYDPTDPDCLKRFNEDPKFYHDFFVQKIEFLTDAAYEYAKIDQSQEFLYRPTQDNTFVKYTLNWLYGKDVKKEDVDNMHIQIDQIVREMAEQEKAGGKPDINSLDAKFNFRGDEISVSDLLNVQKATYSFMDTFQLYAFGGGNDVLSLQTFCERGIVKSISELYYNNLPGNIGKQFQAALDKKLDPHLEACRLGDAQIDFLPEKNKNALIKEHEEGFQRFKGIEGEDKKSLDMEFEKQLSWFEGVIRNKYRDGMYKRETDNLRAVYEALAANLSWAV